MLSVRFSFILMLISFLITFIIVSIFFILKDLLHLVCKSWKISIVREIQLNVLATQMVRKTGHWCCLWPLQFWWSCKASNVWIIRFELSKKNKQRMFFFWKHAWNAIWIEMNRNDWRSPDATWVFNFSTDNKSYSLHKWSVVKHEQWELVYANNIYGTVAFSIKLYYKILQ